MNLLKSNKLVKYFKKNKYLFYLYLYLTWSKYNKKILLKSGWQEPISNNITNKIISGRIVRKNVKLMSHYYKSRKDKIIKQKEDIYPLE